MHTLRRAPTRPPPPPSWAIPPSSWGRCGRAVVLIADASCTSPPPQCRRPRHTCAQIGTDANATPLKAALTGAGVQLPHLKDVAGPSGTALILLQKSGQQPYVFAPSHAAASTD